MTIHPVCVQYIANISCILFTAVERKRVKIPPAFSDLFRNNLSIASHMYVLNISFSISTEEAVAGCSKVTKCFNWAIRLLIVYTIGILVNVTS